MYFKRFTITKTYVNIYSPVDNMSGLGSLSASAWNLDENVFDEITGGFDLVRI